jgi:hypothetical protein
VSKHVHHDRLAGRSRGPELITRDHTVLVISCSVRAKPTCNGLCGLYGSVPYGISLAGGLS